MEDFKIPPLSINYEGKERKVGFEFEFTGIEMEVAASMLAQLYDGDIKQISTYEYKIENSRYGSFKLELDASLFLNKKYEKVLKSMGVDINASKNKEAIENALRDVASTVVPFEIITPPIPLSQISEINRLVQELRKWKAKGTGSSVFYAFGLHLNPEAPSLEPENLLRYLKAFVLLDPWLRKDANVNISRKITPYINEYESDYLRLILKDHYKPGYELMVDDYFRFKNTRNRALDMIPLFLFIDEDFVHKKANTELSSARPTYHYRLPNCSIDDPEWSLSKEWNRWVLVEQLAEDRKALQQYSNAYLKMDKDALFSTKKKWIMLMDRWISNGEQ